MKYDVIIGNPPYTHLRNMENRRYARYPKQRDMAQVFVRWGLDHGEVISYNTTYQWLIKTSDGALEVRKLLLNERIDFLDTEEIRRYSEGQGGDLGTFIFAVSSGSGVYYNDEDVSDIDFLMPGFLISLGIKHDPNTVSITKYAPKLLGNRSVNKFGTATAKWKSFIFRDDGEGDWSISSKRRITAKGEGDWPISSKCRITAKKARDYPGAYKLIRTKDFPKLTDAEFEGEVKNSIVSYKHGLWLLGYLNTHVAFEKLSTYTRSRMVGNYELSNNLWPLLQVPDFDYYKSKHPERHAAFLKWVEDNMRDKNKFLAGIDEEFEKLINNEAV